MSEQYWKERYHAAEEAFQKLKTFTKQVPAGTWCENFRTLAGMVHSLGRDAFWVSLGAATQEENPKMQTQYRCSHCGHLPHHDPAKDCGAIDAAGDECDCRSYARDWTYPVNPLCQMGIPSPSEAASFGTGDICRKPAYDFLPIECDGCGNKMPMLKFWMCPEHLAEWRASHAKSEL